MKYQTQLFVPGNRPERFEKACQAGADLVCIDLEDAVAVDEKPSARSKVLAWLSETTHPHVSLRINNPVTDFGKEDIKALAKSDLTLPFVMVPKVSELQELKDLAALLPDNLGFLFPVIESAAGLVHCESIFSHSRVQCAIFGAIDYSADIDSDMAWETLLYARSRLVAAAAATDVTLFDVPFGDVRDLDGCKADTIRSRQLGIFARSAIHPAQLAMIKEALQPSPEEITYAQRVIRAMEEAKGNVALLDGQLLEEPVVKKARRILARKT